ncbi:MAG: hypothetical protein B6I36_02380 [Desulfobacteraceae bacterium 4572_35.1]|nr:MAG: hypothetical protein B6I36_02380 [Desulfobacteraceae bacterium 4572_35.1]
MSNDDRLKLLRKAIAESSQAVVSRALGYSASTISQIVSNSYAGDPSAVLQRVEEVFGRTSVECPIMGTIPLGKCVDTKRRPFAATNSQRVQQYKACKSCSQNGGVHENQR